MFERPAGSLTLNRFLDVVKDLDDTTLGDEPVVLHSVYSLADKSVMQGYVFVKGNKHIIDIKDHLYIQFYAQDLKYYKSSILDRNLVPNNYNDHYMFSNKLLAEKYLKRCLTDKIMHDRHEQHTSYRNMIFKAFLNKEDDK